MGRTKGSKNGIRRVAIKKNHPDEEQRYEYVIVKKQPSRAIIKEELDDSQDFSLPAFEPSVLRAFRNKHYEKCIELIASILLDSTDENKNHYRILQAASYTMLGKDFQSAHVILDEVLAADPENSFALYGKGVAFYFQKRLNDGLEMFNKAIKANPSEEMERAKEMKVRIDLEQRQAVIFIRKVDHRDLESFDLPRHEQQVEGISEASKDVMMEGTDKAQSVMEPMILDDENIAVHPKQKTRRLSISKLRNQPLKFRDEPDENEENDVKPFRMNDELREVVGPKPDIPEPLSNSSILTTSQDFFDKGMECYLSGTLKKALKMFGKAVKLKPSFAEAEDMGAKSQELLELMDMASLEMNEKNYQSVVGILTEALEIDKTNDFVNRPFYFQRGLAYFHLGKNDESMKDYAQFDRLNKMLDQN